MFNSDKCECNASCYHECMCDWVVKKEWQGLSDVELSLLAEEYTGADGLDVVDYGYAIEAKLKEMNT